MPEKTFLWQCKTAGYMVSLIGELSKTRESARRRAAREAGSTEGRRRSRRLPHSALPNEARRACAPKRCSCGLRRFGKCGRAGQVESRGCVKKNSK